MIENKIRLTQYSHGAGCGCKISPAVLDSILKTNQKSIFDSRLLVGNDKKDDAAVYDLDGETALISTTDFFMPIVDNPFDFGRVAATNAISDVYAMGGKPVLAIAILGWPIDKLPPEVANEVLEGAREICKEAGISLSGGHSIDTPEPIFGLAVNGLVKKSQLKQNSTAMAGCRLYLTKSIGIGALSTAQKCGILLKKDEDTILKSMTTLNKIGTELAPLDGVKAMTDVTGFGLLGHIIEMCEGSNLKAEIQFDNIPIFPNLNDYLNKGCIPGGTNRNWKSYGEKVCEISTYQKNILADPQTSGGLLIAVEKDSSSHFENFMKERGLTIHPFGSLKEQEEGQCLIEVI